MQNNNNTSSDNHPNPTPNRRQRQAKKPDERTDEAGYQKLPHGLRPFGGCGQRDPLHYDSHPYPSMLRFAKHLAPHFDAPRTRHSYYRQLRLVHEFCQADPAAITGEILRDYFLHVKTVKLWKSKTIRHVLPRGLRAIRYHGFCHPAAKIKRERIAFHTGRPLLVGALQAAPVKPPHVVACPCCGEPMKKLLRLLPAWNPGRAPPPLERSRAP
jgi:hypothetical protein